MWGQIHYQSLYCCWIVRIQSPNSHILFWSRWAKKKKKKKKVFRHDPSKTVDWAWKINYFKIFYYYIYTDVQCLSSVSEGFSGSLHGGPHSRSFPFVVHIPLHPPPSPPRPRPGSLAPLSRRTAHNPLWSQCTPGFVCPVLPLDHRANRLTGRHGFASVVRLERVWTPPPPPRYIHNTLVWTLPPPPPPISSLRPHPLTRSLALLWIGGACL